VLSLLLICCFLYFVVRMSTSLRNPRCVFFPSCERPSFIPIHKITDRIIFLCNVAERRPTDSGFLDSNISSQLTCLLLPRLTVLLWFTVLIFELRKTLFFNPLSPELNPICYLLALLDHHFLHVSRIRVKSLTLRLLMLYIYGAPILDVSRSHTTTQHSR